MVSSLLKSMSVSRSWDVVVDVYVHVCVYILYVYETEQKKIKCSLISLEWPESQGSKMPKR